MKNQKVNSWQAWTIGIIGLWLILSAFLKFDATENMVNNLLVGLVVAGIAYTIMKQKVWQAWLCLIVGLWMAIAAFIPSLIVDQGYIWNNVISGSVIAIGGFGALELKKKVSEN